MVKANSQNSHGIADVSVIDQPLTDWCVIS